MTTRRTLSLLAASALLAARARPGRRARRRAARARKAAGARRAAPVQAPDAHALHAPERPQGLARPVRDDPQGARAPHRAGRQRRRPRGPDLDGRPHGRSPPRRHEDAQREPGSRRTPPRWAARSPCSAGENLTTVGGEVLSEFAPAMVDLVADVVRNPAFPESELARLKANLARRLSIAKSQSGQMAAEAFRAAMYPGQSYGRLFPAPEALSGLLAREREGVLVGPLRGGPRRRSTSSASSTRRRPRRRSARAFAGWGKASAPAAAAPKAVDEAHAHGPRPARAPRSPRSGSGCPSSTPRTPTTSRSSSRTRSSAAPSARASRATSASRRATRTRRSARSRSAGRARSGPRSRTSRRTSRAPRSRRSSARSTACAPSRRPRPSSRASRTTSRARSCSRTPRAAGIANQLQFLALHGLPDSYLSGFVARVHAVTPEEVTRLAKTYIRPDADDPRRRRRPQGHRRAAQAVSAARRPP